MRFNTSARFATACLLAGALACASNSARVDDDETAAAQGEEGEQGDTSMTQAPPGYSGMERDTTGSERAPTAIDTFLNTQGTGVPTDTQGYGGLEHPDTSAAARQQSGYDTTSTAQPGQTGADTSSMSPTGTDTSSMSQPGQSGYDTTGATGATGQSDTSGMSGMGMDSTSMSNPQDSIPQ
jgi:hypothetical protein